VGITRNTTFEKQFMTDLEIFYELKKSVLEHYQNSYPYFNGSWKSFSSQDILNLIDDIQLKTKQSVSEKWIYTHLKPETNEKLPRKDMLDILSVYVGKSGWDEFKFTDNSNDNNNDNNNNNVKSKSKNKFGIVLLIFGVLIIGFTIWKFTSNHNQKLEFQNSYTKDSISNEDVKAFVVEDSVEKPIDLKSESLHLEKGTKVVIKSPFYKQKEITISPNEPFSRVELNPNDYAMMLKAFMKSDIKDWQTRKEQLNKILSDNLEVMIMLQNDLGAEYVNKTEFAQKVVIPSASLKKLKIVELKQEKDNKISFLRLTEE
jgi:predicted DNA-binding transcriptional regulator AlpA/sortase (surface protein transpeptidase)